MFFATVCVAAPNALLAAPLSTRATDLAWDPGQPSYFDDAKPAEVQAIFDDLGAAVAAEREAASRRLINLPGSALEQVAAFAKDPGASPEVAAALRRALPILKARARITRRVRRAADETVRGAVAAYDAVGTRDYWDADARAAARLALRPVPLRPPAEADAAAVADRLRRVVDSGCEDPLVHFLLAAAEWPLPTTDRWELVQRYGQAATRLVRSAYPSRWKMTAGARYLVDTVAYPNTVARDAVLEHLPEVLRAAPDWEDAFEQAELAYHALRHDPQGRPGAFKAVAAIYAKARPAEDPGLPTLEGIHLIDHAWEARGTGWADSVGRRAWAQFEERLSGASAALTRAWELDDTNAWAATGMMQVAIGLGHGDEDVARWYGRAMAADPDNRGPGDVRITSLLPRWGGSHEAMLAFGRACFATNNFRGRTVIDLVNVHLMIAREVPDGRAYLARDDVGRDVAACYEGYLALYPRSTWHRSKLALLACEAGRWADTRRLLGRVGDAPNLDVFGSRAVYDYYRRKAAGDPW